MVGKKIITQMLRGQGGSARGAASTPETAEPAAAAAFDAPPFFVIGAPRSGTTMLRDLLRRSARLACPEETHYYRFAFPFGAPGFVNSVKMKLLQGHRELDGVSEAEFDAMLAGAASRADLHDRYMRAFVARNKPEARRWFDKTPQNVYGVLLMQAEFPESAFVHIVRNPLNVVASLKVGKQIKVDDVRVACNFWHEAVTIIEAARPVLGDRLFELYYEDLTRDPVDQTGRLLRFVGEDPDSIDAGAAGVRAERDAYRKVLAEDEIRIVRATCGSVAERYGYEL